MRKISVWLVLTFICTSFALAQDKTIAVSGRVVETESKELVTQATVRLLALPDSSYVAGIATGNKGWFTLPKVKAGKYLLVVSSIGFRTKTLSLQLSADVPDKKIGTVSLEPDEVMLAEAVVVAEAPQVTVREDTLEFNSAAYRTPEGAMLEELVKKLPGAEIDESGNVKINGKEIKKIMVDGKEFFGGDVKTGLKNLPVDMVDKLKTYDKKSDLARITGIDDGEEETVLDLKVKKGMNQGWFGNADVAAGTKDRYSSNVMLNRFVENSQFSLVGSANNVNDQGFSGGGRPSFRNNNGLTATKMIGMNFATQTDKLELGGSVRYNYTDRDASSVSSSERFLKKGNSFANSDSRNRRKNTDFNADFRLEWKPDTLTNIIFRPNLSYGKSDASSVSASGTFKKDPLEYTPNPNDYLSLEWLEGNSADDPLKDIRVNASNSGSLSENKSLSGNATLQLNRRLNSRGRNVTLRGTVGYGDNDNDSYTQSLTRYYGLKSQVPGHSDEDSLLYRAQYIRMPATNYNYTAQVTYSEPIARATFLQLSYAFRYRYSKSDKSTYDLLPLDWKIGQPLPSGYPAYEVDSLGKNAEYHYYNHDVTAGIRFIRADYQLSAGVSLQPQRSTLSYKKGDYQTDTVRTVFNFSPNIDFRYRFSKVSQLRVTYRGRSSQPGMESLLPITDNSNPLNIRMGNPGLKPSFSHNMRAFYNTYNAELQRGIMAHANFTLTQNSIGNVTRYNYDNGGLITRPENINGNWSAFAMFGFNTALKDKRFTVNSFSRTSYSNLISYLYNDETKLNDKTRSTSLLLGEHLNGTFRNDWFEVSVNGSIRYTFERNKLRPENNQEPYTYGYGVSTNIFLPWQMSLSTNITNNARRGYRDTSMNRNELVWNAQIAQNFLKGNAATVSFEIYDILKQQTNVSRSLTSDIRSVSEFNGINSYCMLRFTYRLNIFGNKEARSHMRQGGGFHRPEGPHRDGLGGRGRGRF